MVALNCKTQLDTLRFGMQLPKAHWPLSFCDPKIGPKSQRFTSQRLQDANATKSQTLAFYESQRFSATKILDKFSDDPYPPNLEGGVFTPQILAVGLRKYCNFFFFRKSTPQIRGAIFTPQIRWVWVVRVCGLGHFRKL